MGSNPKRITFLVFFDFFNNGGMAKWVDAKDFGFKNECTDGNIGRRISLIKQFDILFNVNNSGNAVAYDCKRFKVLGMKRNRKIAALSKSISNCNGSLAYGDIGFGDGELN